MRSVKPDLSPITEHRCRVFKKCGQWIARCESCRASCYHNVHGEAVDCALAHVRKQSQIIEVDFSIAERWGRHDG